MTARSPRTHEHRLASGEADDAPTRRRSTRPSSVTWLPTGRGVLGGALIATAVAGVLVAHRAAAQPPTTRYVVATHEIEAGTLVGPDDLGTIVADVPDGTAVVPAEDADRLIGRVAQVPLHPMDLMRDGDLFAKGRFTASAAIEVALELPPTQALLGTLRVGDRVDVMSTDPSGQGTTVIATGVMVTEVADADQDAAIGTSGTSRIRLGVPDSATAEALVDAAVRTEVTLALPGPGRAPAASATSGDAP